MSHLSAFNQLQAIDQPASNAASQPALADGNINLSTPKLSLDCIP